MSIGDPITFDLDDLSPGVMIDLDQGEDGRWTVTQSSRNSEPSSFGREQSPESEASSETPLI